MALLQPVFADGLISPGDMCDSSHLKDILFHSRQVNNRIDAIRNLLGDTDPEASLAKDLIAFGNNLLSLTSQLLYDEQQVQLYKGTNPGEYYMLTKTTGIVAGLDQH